MPIRITAGMEGKIMSFNSSEASTNHPELMIIPY
ncbi:hypothetical protein J2T14_003681 [Paenibacillus harenae]|nr:hypothetical protein [Paenibacillus harenae]